MGVTPGSVGVAFLSQAQINLRKPKSTTRESRRLVFNQRRKHLQGFFSFWQCRKLSITMSLYSFLVKTPGFRQGRSTHATTAKLI